MVAKLQQTTRTDLLVAPQFCLHYAGQLLAPNLRVVDLKLSSSLHWSSLEACPRLEKVAICLQPSQYDDDPSDPALCELSLQGCNPDCLQTIEQFHLKANSLKEDGHLKSLVRHKLRKLSMAIKQPQLSAFDILELTLCKWAFSAVTFEESFRCDFRR